MCINRMMAATLALLLGCALPLPAQESPARVFDNRVDERVRRASDRGLEWLSSQQRPNGSWANKIGYKLYDTYNGEDGEHVGVTALAGMAFAGAGHLPGRGKFGREAERALRFVLDSSRMEDGYITSNGTRMYSHSFATMFLAEILGMSRREDVKTALQRSVALLVAAQNREGGWRYSPSPVDADLSVTVCVLQGLRAARNSGVSVPVDTIERATRYVRRCSTRAGFSYQAPNDYAMNDARITFALTACGIVSLTSAGVYDAQEIRNGIRLLEMGRNDLSYGRYHYFYSHYYGSQAMYLAGPDHFDPYYRRVRAEILAAQQPDGGWIDDVGRPYATAMACIVLQMPCEWLPIFQK